MIDSIRTAVLMAGEGIKPGHHDPGYRLRQLIKRFVLRNHGLDVDLNYLVDSSFDYWSKWGVNSNVNRDVIKELIDSEIERSKNVFIFSIVEKSPEINIKSSNINMNQSNKNFMEDLYSRVSIENHFAIDEAIKKIL